MRRMVAAVLACLGFSLPTGAGAADLLEKVLAERSVTVCIWPEYFAITYRNARTGRLQGLDIDLAAEFARDLGVRLNQHETSFAKLLDDLEQRRCDIAMMGVGVTPQRAMRIDFSTPYLRSDMVAVTSRINKTLHHWNDIDRPGRIVAVQAGTIMETHMRESLRHASIHVTTRPGERDRDVESGRADVFIADYPYSRRLLLEEGWARVIEPDRPVQPTPYAYAVPRGEARWLERVNRFVDSISRDGRLESAARRHGLEAILIRPAP
jgi:ABC-type amino acid transport substrate-binding protein